MEFNLPFPNGEMSPMLKSKGWRECDIMDIRQSILEGIKEAIENPDDAEN